MVFIYLPVEERKEQQDFEEQTYYVMVFYEGEAVRGRSCDKSIIIYIRTGSCVYTLRVTLTSDLPAVDVNQTGALYSVIS